MSNPNRQPADDAEAKLPESLVNDLRAAFAGRVEVPGEVDARIWAEARRHSLGQQRRRVLVRRLTAGTAAAASIALVAWLAWPAGYLAEPSPTRPEAKFAAQAPALAPSRRVDILDAFALARKLEQQAPVDAAWDLNQDGQVDHQDVRVLAARAVSLEERAIQ